MQVQAWRAHLRQKKAAGQAIVGVAAGCGAVAAGARDADFLLTSAEAVLSMDNQPQVIGRIGYVGNSNRQVLAMRDRVLGQNPEVPVFAGLGAAEPFAHPLWVAHQMVDAGFMGVANRPTSSGWVGSFGEGIESMGVGFSAECAVLQQCRLEDIPTIGFVFSREEACQMAAAAPDLLILRIPKTDGETYGWSDAPSSAQAWEEAAETVRTIRDAFPQQLILCCGGDSVEDAHRAVWESGADGYFWEGEEQTAVLRSAVESSAREAVGAICEPLHTPLTPADLRKKAGKALIWACETGIGLVAAGAERYTDFLLASHRGIQSADANPWAERGVDVERLSAEAARRVRSGAPQAPVLTAVLSDGRLDALRQQLAAIHREHSWGAACLPGGAGRERFVQMCREKSLTCAMMASDSEEAVQSARLGADMLLIAGDRDAVRETISAVRALGHDCLILLPLEQIPGGRTPETWAKSTGADGFVAGEAWSRQVLCSAVAAWTAQLCAIQVRRGIHTV